LPRNAQVRARAGELKAEQAAAAKLDRHPLRQRCERAILAKPSDAHPDSDICETVVTKAGPVPILCSKLGAIDRLVKLCGWNGPDSPDGTITVIIGDGRPPASASDVPAPDE
jgi:hypothetical protein